MPPTGERFREWMDRPARGTDGDTVSEGSREARRAIR